MQLHDTCISFIALLRVSVCVYMLLTSKPLWRRIASVDVGHVVGVVVVRLPLGHGL